MSDGGNALARPPRRCTPAEFYGGYLPEVWRQLAGDRSWPPWRVEIQVEIAGMAEAPVHHLVLDGGELGGSTGAAATPLVVIECDGQSWRFAVHDLAARIVRRVNKRLAEVHEDIGKFAGGRAKSLEPDEIVKMPGTVIIDFTDDAGDRGVFTLRVGSGSGPCAEVLLGEDDLWALLEARGDLLGLLKSRVRLEGDVAYVLQLARWLQGP